MINLYSNRLLNIKYLYLNYFQDKARRLGHKARVSKTECLVTKCLQSILLKGKIKYIK